MDTLADKSGGIWSSIKACLQGLDKNGLIEVIHSVYESDAEIQQALTTRFVPSDRSINRIRRRIMNLVYPNPLGTLPIRAGDALRTIRKFYKASDDPSATVAMLLDAIEAGTAQAEDLGIEDESYFNALAQMMRMLVTLQSKLSRPDRRIIRDRLVRIYDRGKHVPWGHADVLAQTLGTVRQMCR